MLKRLLTAFALVIVGTAPAFAHLDPLEHGSFAAGFSHPLFGLDHILAMVAVGLWAASVGGKALWAVPTAFVATMAVGFGAALLGMPLPFVEPVILASLTVFVDSQNSAEAEAAEDAGLTDDAMESDMSVEGEADADASVEGEVAQ